MRELHVVGTTDDGRTLVLATSPDATRGGFRLAADDRLRAALRGEVGRPGQPRPGESALSPREIQARLRAGQTPEEVARAAGVPVARVERFSGPVLSERARVLDEARAAVLTRPRLGPSAAPLGDAVDGHLAETAGLRPDSVAWTARRGEEGAWVVEVAFTARGRARTAAWTWEPHRRVLTAVDSASAVLGHLEAAPRRAAGASRSSARSTPPPPRSAPPAGAGDDGPPAPDEAPVPPAAAPVRARRAAAGATTRPRRATTGPATGEPAASGPATDEPPATRAAGRSTRAAGRAAGRTAAPPSTRAAGGTTTRSRAARPAQRQEPEPAGEQRAPARRRRPAPADDWASALLPPATASASGARAGAGAPQPAGAGRTPPRPTRSTRGAAPVAPPTPATTPPAPARAARPSRPRSGTRTRPSGGPPAGAAQEPLADALPDAPPDALPDAPAGAEHDLPPAELDPDAPVTGRAVGRIVAAAARRAAQAPDARSAAGEPGAADEGPDDPDDDRADVGSRAAARVPAAAARRRTAQPAGRAAAARPARGRTGGRDVPDDRVAQPADRGVEEAVDVGTPARTGRGRGTGAERGERDDRDDRDDRDSPDAPADEPRDAGARRATVPAWADVLLGATPGRRPGGS